MTVHEYLQRLGISPDNYIDLAFMIGETSGENIGDRKIVYFNTPRRTLYEWYNLDKIDPKERVRSKVLDYVVLNTKVHDINWLSGANWNCAIDSNLMMMLLVMSRDELFKYYGDFYKGTEEYIDKKIIEDIESGKNPWVKKSVK